MRVLSPQPVLDPTLRLSIEAFPKEQRLVMVGLLVPPVETLLYIAS